MRFENKNIDELIEFRKEARLSSNWKLSDEIRDLLDSKLAFVFDTKFGQEVYHLNDKYFCHKDKKLETIAMSNRQFVEYRIKQDLDADKNFDARLYSMQHSAGLTKNKTK